MSDPVGYLVGQIGEFSGLRVAIPDKGLIIGRSLSQADLVVDHSLVSRKHAQIAPGKDGKLYLIDLQSRNGTHVNGRKITAPVALNPGDKLDFGGEGQVVFVFESADTTSVSSVLKEAFGETVAPAEWKAGDVIGGRLEVHGTLGKGGFGAVYLVYDRDIEELRALKTIRRELLAERVARDAFKREALLWLSLDEHPFILSARWVDEYYGRLFVLMDYVAPDKQRCVTLSDHLAIANGPLDIDQALEWAIQFCVGMEHAVAHGIKCHRDIKPANILITQDAVLKITDFGLAAAAEVAWHSSKGVVDSTPSGSEQEGFSFSALQVDGMLRCGTPGYMPPEVFRGETVDIRSDIYSFGLVLWQMGTGSKFPPFLPPYRRDIGDFLREVYERQMDESLPRIKRPLWPVVKRCLRAKPTKRYSDFGELREDLEAVFRKRTGKTISSITERRTKCWFLEQQGRVPSCSGAGRRGGSLLR
jgi:serine/threonine protein kinase